MRWLLRQMDKLRGGSELTQWGHYNSRWYVQYSVDERSVTMHYSTAKVYAGLFGGKVKHVGDSQ